MAARKGWRFWLGWLFVFVLLAALGVFGKYLFTQKQIRSHLEAVIVQQDRDHPGWRFHDLLAARENIPDAENAALKVLAVKKLIGPKDLFTLDFDLSRHPANQGLPASVAIQLTDGLEPLKPAVLEARMLVRLTKGRFTLTYSSDFPSPEIAPIVKAREVVYLLRYDALLRAKAKDLGGAVASCRASLRVGQSIGDEPSVLTQLTRIACVETARTPVEWVLGQGEPPVDELSALQASLEEESRFGLFEVCVRGERAAVHQLFVELENRGEPPHELIDREFGKYRRKYLGILPIDYIREAHADLFPYFNRLQEIARDPPHERPRLIGNLLDEVRQRSPIAESNLFAMDGTERADRRRLAVVRCTVAALAAERFRQTKGRWPASTNELSGLADAPALVDPCDGNPLRFQKQEGGMLIYSVGVDGIDNGGVIDRLNQMQSGADIGFRLWDTDQRGQPPAPEPPPPPPEEPPPQ